VPHADAKTMRLKLDPAKALPAMIYMSRGDLTAHPDERCNVCKGFGFLRVGL
jgi:hypothetical protein